MQTRYKDGTWTITLTTVERERMEKVVADLKPLTELSVPFQEQAQAAAAGIAAVLEALK